MSPSAPFDIVSGDAGIAGLAEYSDPRIFLRAEAGHSPEMCSRRSLAGAFVNDRSGAQCSHRSADRLRQEIAGNRHWYLGSATVESAL